MIQAQTSTRRSRQANPERWQRALARGLAEGVTVRQVNDSGAWVATSGTDATMACLLEITGTIAHGCTCPAGQHDDPVCKHRAIDYHLIGALDLPPGAGPPPSSPPHRRPRRRAPRRLTRVRRLVVMAATMSPEVWARMVSPAVCDIPGECGCTLRVPFTSRGRLHHEPQGNRTPRHRGRGLCDRHRHWLGFEHLWSTRRQTFARYSLAAGRRAGTWWLRVLPVLAPDTNGSPTYAPAVVDLDGQTCRDSPKTR